ncbi:MAG: hypothetical protein WCQ82_04280 [Bacteroidaceae bacterium]|nr:hypothetical protein [Bacteroidaceae bacterium]
MKRFILISFVLFFTQLLFAQERAKTAMVLRIDTILFSDNQFNANKEYAEMVRAKIAEAAVSSGRFTVIDDDAAKSQIKYMSNEAFIDLSPERRIEYLNNVSNDFSLSCTVTRCQITKKTSGASGYTCVMALTPRIVNTNSSQLEVAESRTFISNFKKIIVRNTVEAAIDEALQSLTQKMVDYFTNNFAVYGAMKKYEGKYMIISCGAEQNVHKKDIFEVNYVTLIRDGNGDFQRTEKLVGIAKVVELLPDGTSRCKMKEGKNQIIQSFEKVSMNSFVQCKLVLK